MQREQEEQFYVIDVEAVESNEGVIRACLSKILASNQFKSSPRMSKFIDHIVNETINGRGDRLKEYNIAVDVFGRKDGTDIIGDSLVRTSATRLRDMLGAYNLDQGKDDPIRITIPKGSYTPIFYQKSPSPVEEKGVTSIIPFSDEINTNIKQAQTVIHLNQTGNGAQDGQSKGINSREMMAILLMGGVAAGILFISYISIILLIIN